MSRQSMRSIIIFSLLVLSGCGTDWKIKDFLDEMNTIDTIQKPLSGSLSWYNHDAEQLLLGVNSDHNNYGRYEEYSQTTLQNAISQEKTVVLVVLDSACDDCLALDSDIRNSLSQLPDNLIILSIDMESAQELYAVEELDSVIYLSEFAEIRHVVQWEVTSLDTLLFYL